MMTNYLANALSNLALRGVSFTAPTTIYLALFTSEPTRAGVGTEVQGGSYARRPITFNIPNNGANFSSADIVFNTSTTSWGTITHIGIYDAATGGNMLFIGRLTTPRTIQGNDQLRVNAGDIYLRIT